MAKKKGIPGEVQRHAEEVVARFNSEHFDDAEARYIARFKGPYLYLDRADFGSSGRICRLKYSGEFEDWEFAISSSVQARMIQMSGCFPAKTPSMAASKVRCWPCWKHIRPN